MKFNELVKLFVSKYSEGKIEKLGGGKYSICFKYWKLSDAEKELLEFESMSNVKTSVKTPDTYVYKGTVEEIALKLKLIKKEIPQEAERMDYEEELFA